VKQKNVSSCLGEAGTTDQEYIYFTYTSWTCNYADWWKIIIGQIIFTQVKNQAEDVTSRYICIYVFFTYSLSDILKNRTGIPKFISSFKVVKLSVCEYVCVLGERMMGRRFLRDKEESICC